VTEPKLDPLLLDPTRLSITALLASTEWAEFSFVRDSAQLSDSTLSKRIAQLSDVDYVEVRKGYVGKRPRTWLNLSKTGRAALRAHIAALQKIATQADHAPS
jgi:DNA-binding MarR family transcriptional regulator